MKTYDVQQDYTETGTRYYTVEADTLEEAIERVRNELGADDGPELYKQRTWSYDESYDDSEEITAMSADTGDQR